MSALPWNLAASTGFSVRRLGSVACEGRSRGARPDPADLAVEDRRDHDERALEEVLPGLREVEEDDRVEDLHDEAGAEQRPDERAPATQQAGPTQDDGGDAAQRVA